MENSLTQLGVGGIFAVLVIQQVLTFVGKKKNGNGSDLKAVAEIIKQRDNDGVPRCYTPRSLERTLNKLADNVSAQTEMMKEIGRTIDGCKYHEMGKQGRDNKRRQ